jgi:hypothetical protein
VDNEVFITSAKPLQTGDFILATINDASEYDLFGEVAEVLA